MVPIGLMLNSLTLLMILTVFLLLVNFFQFLTWKILVYTYTKDFSWENGSKFGRHWIFFFKLPDLYDKFQVDGQYRTILFSSTFISSTLSIWLNYFENNCHFGYITKSLKAPGFKRSAVKAKFLPALCYWAWRGVFANSLSVGSAVVCPKRIIN